MFCEVRAERLPNGRIIVPTVGLDVGLRYSIPACKLVIFENRFQDGLEGLLSRGVDDSCFGMADASNFPAQVDAIFHPNPLDRVPRHHRGGHVGKHRVVCTGILADQNRRLAQEGTDLRRKLRRG